MGRNIPAVEVNNYTAIFTKPIFKNQAGEWYRDVGYKDSLDIIHENFKKAADSFIAIGYYLKHINKNKLYLEGNYNSIWECAEGEFGLSQSAASRFMNMNDAFSVNGDTPVLDDKYKDFNKSQLQELLALSDEQREEQKEKISPEQTVSEIRQIVKKVKQADEPTEKEIRTFYHGHAADIPRAMLKEKLKERFRHSYYSGKDFSYKGSPRGLIINDKEEITWSYLARLIGQYFPRNENIREAEETEQLIGQMNVNDYPGIVPEPVTLAEPEIIVEAEELEVIYGDSGAGKVYGVKVSENNDNDKVSGLPILKNDEQRKVWVENYKAWGLWYTDNYIDVNYYKYDFPDGSRLIAAEYPDRESYWSDEKADEVYYHLLERGKEKYDKTTYDEKFRNSTNGITEIIKFLKKVQK